MPHVLVPTAAAGLSAVGGHFADVVATASRALRTTTRDFDYAGANAALAAIGHELTEFVDRVGSDDDARTRREYFCEARYANQLWELDVSLGDRDRFRDARDVTALSDSFDALHHAVFAVNQPGETLETVSWRGDVRIARSQPALPQAVEHARAAAPTTRRVWSEGAWQDFPVHAGGTLPIGATVAGPAIIEEPTTTIVLPDGAIATVRPGHYLVEVAP